MSTSAPGVSASCFQPIKSAPSPQALTQKQYSSISPKDSTSFSSPQTSSLSPHSISSQSAARRRSSASSHMTTSPSPIPNLAVKPKNAISSTPKSAPSSTNVTSATNVSINLKTANTKPTTKPPAIAIKANGTPNLPQLTASRVWVLPPRPKPGRKPSNDTPATVSIYKSIHSIINLVSVFDCIY